MMKLSKEVLAKIVDLAKSDEEKGGVILSDGSFIEIENQSQNKYYGFVFDLSVVEKKIKAIVHTHGYSSAEPSIHDILSCVKSGFPWMIVGFYGDEIKWIDHTMDISHITDPLLDRPFVYGHLDCYTIVRDWYKKYGLSLNDYQRNGLFWRDVESEYNPYVEFFEQEGFFELDDNAKIMPNDLILMSIGSKRQDCANHAGVYVGDNKIIHHIFNSLSRYDIYTHGSPWHLRTIMRLRHKEYKSFIC